MDSRRTLSIISILLSLIVIINSGVLTQITLGQSEELQLEGLFTAFLNCWSLYQQLGPLNMPVPDQYECGGNMQNSFDALRHLSVTREGLMKFAAYSPSTKDLAFRAASIIAPYTSDNPTRIGNGAIAGQGSTPTLTDQFPYGGQSGGDLVNGNENYNPQLGTQVQCTATGTCVDVNAGVNAALDTTTNQPVEIDAFGIPPGSDLQELTPAPMSPAE